MVTAAAFRGSKGIEGYASRSSVLPGDDVTLFVSSPTPTYTITAFRMTGDVKSGGLKVWSSGELKGGRQSAARAVGATRVITADWKASATVATTDWVPGPYLFRLAATDGSASFIPLIVRSVSTKGTVVISFSDLTWQAYNEWGGKSAYKDVEDGGFSGRSYAVSFDRPYSKGRGSGGYLSYEHPAVLLAQRTGVPLSYVTGLDVATVPGLLDGALGYVSLGHDEYWTGAERDAVESARDAGMNLGFLGANVSYWQVRLRDADSGPHRVIDIYKSGADPVDGKKATLRFRDLQRGENRLTGMLYECFPAKGKYTVLDPEFFLFAGTGAKKGSSYSDLNAVEVDRAYPIGSTPRPLQVVAKSKTRCGDASTWSTSTYYTVKSGAGVFATGTMGWVLKAMSKTAPDSTRKFVDRVTANLFREMAQGPMGARHPATDNLDDLGLGTKNPTGAA